MSFRDNLAEHRYELVVEGYLTFADYRDVGHDPSVRVIMHVETSRVGHGYASRLMAEIVADAKARGQKLRASCAFAVAYFKRHSGEVAPVAV